MIWTMTNLQVRESGAQSIYKILNLRWTHSLPFLPIQFISKALVSGQQLWSQFVQSKQITDYKHKTASNFKTNEHRPLSGMTKWSGLHSKNTASPLTLLRPDYIRRLKQKNYNWRIERKLNIQVTCYSNKTNVSFTKVVWMVNKILKFLELKPPIRAHMFDCQ